MGEVKRPYRQKARSEQAAATRRRIVEAAVELHSTVGPAETSLSAVARNAGVSRPTLYAHFPDEATLFQACTMHWLGQDPPPDPTAWSAIDDPRERLHTALIEIYSHFSRNEQMIEKVFRDMYVVESMRAFNVPLVEGAFAQMAQVLTSAFDDTPPLATRREALVAVAISFDTWKVLSERGFSAAHSAELMTDVAARCIAGPGLGAQEN